MSISAQLEVLRDRFEDKNPNRITMKLVNHVIIEPVISQEDLKEFVSLPHTIYKDFPYWPGQDDEKELALHLKEYNYPLRYLKTQLFLAKIEGRVVGRVSAIINEQHNRRWNDNIGFFGHFECINEHAVALKLLKTAEQWIKNHGKDEIYGPFSYTYYDILGILVHGFDDRSTYANPYNPEYYSALVEKAGYRKLKDLVEIMTTSEEFYINTCRKMPDFEHLLEKEGITFRTIDENNLREEFAGILSLYNDSFSQHWATNILTEEEWIALLEASYRSVPKDLFLIAECNGEPISFIFAVNDDNEILYSSRHRLDYEAKRVRVYILGVKAEYQKMGVGKWSMVELAKRIRETKYKEVSLSWIDESNTKSLNLCKGLGGPVDKVFRVYHKKI